jgi:hypothetical protein
MNPADYAPPQVRQQLASTDTVLRDANYIRDAAAWVTEQVEVIKEKRMEIDTIERPAVDPIVAGLLDHMPRPGSVWPAAQRKQFIALLEGAFELIYKDGTGVSQ